jgi:hypothetical protein
MRLKTIVGKLMFGNLDTNEANLGQRVQEQIAADLALQPVAEFAELLDLKDLKGDSTGYVKVYGADKLERMAFLSIDIMPGMRYFNIHIIPDHHYKLPRFNFEGMVSTKGSQLSMDLYPDHDIVLDFDFIRHNYFPLSASYEKAKKHPLIHPEPSRLPHMRALCSPYFLLANKVPAEALADMEGFALAYLKTWIGLYKNAQRVTEEEAQCQLHRRQLIARTIIDNDPDRSRVVNVYGEQTTCAIERAAML